MKIDAGLMSVTDLSKVADSARKLEAEGYDGLITAEMSADPFFPLVLAAEHTLDKDIVIFRELGVGCSQDGGFV